MSAVPSRLGDFTGWERYITAPGEVMAWHWPTHLAPCDAVFERCFPVVAIGTKSGDVVIRTGPNVPNALVEPLLRLVAQEASAGRPIGLGLLPGRVDDGDDPTVLYVSLYAATEGRLERFFGYMTELLRKDAGEGA